MALNKKDLEQAILIEKEKGMSDIQIGKKYGVTYKYIEKVITKTKGINISRLNGKKGSGLLNCNCSTHCRIQPTG